MHALLELTKPRITQLVVLTAAAGFYAGSRGRIDLWLFLHAMIGTALVAAGTNALNQLRERDVDARMQRTQGRPLPSGRLTPRAAAWFAGTISIVGVAYLGLAVNALTATLAAGTLASYVFLYTPLKRRSSLGARSERRSTRARILSFPGASHLLAYHFRICSRTLESVTVNGSRLCGRMGALIS